MNRSRPRSLSLRAGIPPLLLLHLRVIGGNRAHRLVRRRRCSRLGSLRCFRRFCNGTVSRCAVNAVGREGRTLRTGRLRQRLGSLDGGNWRIVLDFGSRSRSCAAHPSATSHEKQGDTHWTSSSNLQLDRQFSASSSLRQLRRPRESGTKDSAVASDAAQLVQRPRRGSSLERGRCRRCIHFECRIDRARIRFLFPANSVSTV